MTARQHFQTEAPEAEAAHGKVLVWDAPVRVFHWLMVLAFAGAWLTGEEDGWRLVHVTLGYTMAGLVAFRLAWGLVGTRYARFSDFVRGPGSVLRYFRALVHGKPEHYTGHNPAGAVAIVTMLALTLLVALSGWAHWHGYGGHTMEEVHEVLATLMLAVVGIHVAAVLLSSWLHHENLVKAMIGGRKTGRPRDGIRGARRGVAAVVLLAVLGFWWLQSQDPVGAGQPAERAAPSARHDAGDDEG
ncbi:cytochrome b/b6 domain-containing protein [Massilia sp. UMI-21]|nr:cytochrome b/b6 domain-containing protein [Massilia sp. UMI-21]